jgi:hypothetical protein
VVATVKQPETEDDLAMLRLDGVLVETEEEPEPVGAGNADET